MKVKSDPVETVMIGALIVVVMSQAAMLAWSWIA